MFCLKASEDASKFQPDCDTPYVVKLLRRDQSESNYMPLKESLNSKLPFLADPKDSELKFLHEKFLSMQGNGISQPTPHTRLQLV